MAYYRCLQMHELVLIMLHIQFQITVIIGSANEGLYNLYFHNCYGEDPVMIDMKVHNSIYNFAKYFNVQSAMESACNPTFQGIYLSMFNIYHGLHRTWKT